MTNQFPSNVLDFDVRPGHVTPGGPVYARIVAAFIRAIEAGSLAPGVRLPTESALARQMGVNRLTVSRAYDELRGVGAIEQRRGAGSFVAAKAPHRPHRPGLQAPPAIHVVVGERSLANCSRATAFVVMDILDGLCHELGPARSAISYAAKLDHALQEQVRDGDAVLCVGHGLEADPSVVRALQARRVPLLSVWNRQSWLPQVPNLTVDPLAAQLGCRHLVRCGYRKIGFIGRKQGRDGQVSSKFASYTSVLHECGLDLQAKFILDVPSEPGRTFAAVQTMVARGALPDALFIDADDKALEALCALRMAGLGVPGDLGLVAYGAIPESAQCDPPLTTVRPPRHEVGRRAAQLIQQWNGQPDALNEILPGQLLERSSTQQH